MTLDEVIARLRSAEPKIRAQGVAALYLFGSYARNEATAGSDVDVFVDPASELFYDLERFMGAYDEIRQALAGLPVGYGTREALSPHIRDGAEHDAIRVF